MFVDNSFSSCSSLFVGGRATLVLGGSVSTWKEKVIASKKFVKNVVLEWRQILFHSYKQTATLNFIESLKTNKQKVSFFVRIWSWSADKLSFHP
jgi:hypothetical protein